jgi:hypothetical protein
MTMTQTAMLNALCEAVTPGPDDWNPEGVVLLPGLLARNPMLTAYKRAWWAVNGRAPTDTPPPEWYRPHGWPHATPYMDCEALLDLALQRELSTALASVVGQQMGLHLCLTGWVSTTRNWHQDGYLNPPAVGDRYAAVWIALDDIDPASGPFQYVPGSHRWFRITQPRIGRFVDLQDPLWPSHSEQVLTDFLEGEIAARGAEVVTYVPKRGDVLIWHPRLVHRGSLPADPTAKRPTLICHYSGVRARPDMPPPIHYLHDGADGWYFPIGGHQPVR